jgi:uncharacterized protein (DUF1501 family)
MNTLNASKRLFLRQAGLFSTLGAASPLALNLAAIGAASAQSASDYKALVCVFLFGGNDAMNTVLPTDEASWANYSAVRNQKPDSIALMAPSTAKSGLGVKPENLGGVLPISPARSQGRTYALHPMLGQLQTLFNANKRLAVVANVGPLLVPTTKAQFAQFAHPKPRSLFSHNDQQNTWQSFLPEGATLGWGGRMADVVASMNGRAVFTSISASGNAVWLAGQNVQQFQLGTTGAIRLGADQNGRTFGSANVTAALHKIVGESRNGHLFETDLANVAKRSIDAEVFLREALKPPSEPAWGTAPDSGAYNPALDPKLHYASALTGIQTFNPLASQLQVVARMIDASNAPGVEAKRQVFFVSLNGFDNHDDQNRNHTELMAKLSHALAYFDTTLTAMGAQNKVTTFTASDFGRTFTSNGDGTDHGWGAHHFVMGGAVKGGDLYGNFPVLGLKNAKDNQFDSSPNQLGNGSLLPEISVDQYGSTLGRWFGLNDGQLLDVFPNLSSFDAAARNLGFMR